MLTKKQLYSKKYYIDNIKKKRAGFTIPTMQKVYAPKPCIDCGEQFQPRGSHGMRCEPCRKIHERELCKFNHQKMLVKIEGHEIHIEKKTCPECCRASTCQIEFLCKPTMKHWGAKLKEYGIELREKHNLKRLMNGGTK
jgi:hypothetical protein